MEKIIKAAVERGASDLLIKAGDVFRARINGKLVPLTKQRLTPDQTRAIALKLMPGEEERGRIDRITDYDCSWGMPGVGRFRVNVLRQRSSFMIVMRVIPFAVPTLDDLGLPDVVGRLAEGEQGLLVVTGVSGSGKSSTVAAMLNHINRNLERHIVTVENPIEFLHRDVKCSVTQREIGVDTQSFAQGLQAALRQDPDVIVIGELADTETLDTAIKAAERGHLVITSLHAPNVAHAFSRLNSMFEPSEREIGRIRLADVVAGVIGQRLVPRKDEKGRVVAVEVLVGTPETRALLREPDKDAELLRVMEKDTSGDMRTLEQSVQRLLDDGLITTEAAAALGVGGAGSR